MQKVDKLLQLYRESDFFKPLIEFAGDNKPGHLQLKGLSGSAGAVLASALMSHQAVPMLCVLPDRESAAYFFNDLENLLQEKDLSYEERNIFFFPATYKKNPGDHPDKAHVLMRTEVVNRLATERQYCVLVSYPEALAEKVPAARQLQAQLLDIRTGDKLSVDFLMDLCLEYGFTRADFVVEPGQFSMRGGIFDLFSFANDYPYRIEIIDQQVESLRSFRPEDQLSIKQYGHIRILPDPARLQKTANIDQESLFESMPEDYLLWSAATTELFERMPDMAAKWPGLRVIEYGPGRSSAGHVVEWPFSPQPAFNKNFELLIAQLEKNQRERISNLLISDNPRQLQRLESIFETIHAGRDHEMRFRYESMTISLHEGFTDHLLQLSCFTDHQIFERYHRYRLRDKFPGKQALGLKELASLKPGDYVTHIDHGIGIFSGLEKIEVNGRLQEAIRLIYKDNDILYISIHSLHRIARYSGKEGALPSLHRLGSNAWSRLKEKTKRRIKDIARDLISLYARRKAREGFAFSPDSYLQHELEASFIFEDTPDQVTATADVKADMENTAPMDRLICGDVGFGKTEIAIRAAFKAATDSKQVAVLVPTTILALQHFYTFSERLRGFPCSIDYISRFKSPAAIKKSLQKLKSGETDILIGTHRLTSKDVEFKDLGLLIIDEEQKFGVAAKEKLKKLRVSVDTLTLSATPIPRTLQFSLMGARDMSQINTPPPNRYPIITELHVFNEALIKEAIMMEISRGGQVFFVHNRVQNIAEVAGLIQRLCPDLRIATGHGQLSGDALEKIMMDFIHGEYDVLVSTSIIESGLDIPNANTIIINNAHHFGLSDLHQMRGRVGRTNKKAFCYLLSPPMSTLSDDARKRLRAIEEFSDLGSGFNIAMRDLDIRGAGNLLGAEQSGFISDIGYEMYHKILDEAIAELRETEFKDQATQQSPDGKLSGRDCQLETDLELMIPSDYVSNIQERLNLYKDLDNAASEDELQVFARMLHDRFGPLPEQLNGLLEAIRLRWLARELGFEKVILKSSGFIGHFTSDQSSAYFQGAEFGKILAWAQANPHRCKLREGSDKLSLRINDIEQVQSAIDCLRQINQG